jgi:hypothetical protein
VNVQVLVAQLSAEIKRFAPERSWMSVAHQLGFFMIRDFQNLAGNSPSDVFQQSGDYQP